MNSIPHIQSTSFLGDNTCNDHCGENDKASLFLNIVYKSSHFQGGLFSENLKTHPRTILVFVSESACSRF